MGERGEGGREGGREGGTEGGKEGGREGGREEGEKGTHFKCDLLLLCQPSHTPLGMKTSPSVLWSCRGRLSLAELLQWRGRKTGERERERQQYPL